MELPADEKNELPDELTRRLNHGDQEALASLFLQHRERLWRMVNFRMDQRLHGRVDPEDVLQEAFLAAARHIKNCDGELTTSPFVWLRMMVLQTLTDLHRHHLGVQMRSVYRETVSRDCKYPETTSVSLAAQFIARLTSPSQVVARRETFEQVEQAIAGMEPLDQEVLALRHFEELSNGEVAEVLGIQQKAASIRYVRAIKRLKVILSPMPGFSKVDQDGRAHGKS